MIYPLRFKKVFIKEKIWGGKSIRDRVRNGITRKWNYRWVMGSGVHIQMEWVSLKMEKSKGKTLQEVYDTYKSELVGEKVYEEYGHLFPLLIKYLISMTDYQSKCIQKMSKQWKSIMNWVKVSLGML